MITPKQIAEKTMTPEKRQSAKNDFFAYYIGRPLSYVLTVPFLALDIKPNTISFLSFFPSIIGFFLMGFGQTELVRILGALLFFLWDLMDGVDGNVARYTGKTSVLGTVWDAASGYLAMMLMYFAAGVSIMNTPGGWLYSEAVPDYYYLVAAGLTSQMVLFSRLVMNKKMALYSEKVKTELFGDVRKSFPKMFVVNVTAPSGFIQVILFLSVAFHLLRAFVLAYFVFQLLVTVFSMAKMLKE